MILTRWEELKHGVADLCSRAHSHRDDHLLNREQQCCTEDIQSGRAACSILLSPLDSTLERPLLRNRLDILHERGAMHTPLLRIGLPRIKIVKRACSDRHNRIPERRESEQLGPTIIAPNTLQPSPRICLRVPIVFETVLAFDYLEALWDVSTQSCIA